MGRGRRRPRPADLAPSVAALACVAWVHRPLASGSLPGGVGDARWTIAVHEHWYRVWRGEEAVRDLPSFSPVARTLGTSDAFVVQGQLHALARALGGGIVEAWALACVLTFAIGALGVAALSRRVLDRTWARVALVVACTCSYPVYLQSGHVQLAAILWPAWLVVAALDLAAGRHVTRSRLVLAVVPPLLALSSWYVLALTGLLAAVVTVLRTVVSTVDERACWWRRAGGWRPGRALVVPVVLAALGWAATAWIYLAGAGTIAEPTWADVEPFLPRWYDLANASGFGGGVWGPLYERWYLDARPFELERAEGFGPLLGAVIVVLLVVHARRAGRGAPPLGRRTPVSARTLVALLAACVATPLLLLVDDAGRSLFRPIWALVPAMSSIRAPYRVMGLVVPLAAFALVRTAESVVEARRRPSPSTAQDPPSRVGAADAGDPGPGQRGGRRSGRPAWAIAPAALAVGGVVVEMHRPPHAAWTPDELLPGALRERIEEVREGCDAVVVVDEDPTDPPWVAPVDGVVLATLSGVPTPQGYGRAVPTGHPGLAADPTALDGWMRSLGFEGTTCAVSSAGVERRGPSG